MTVGLRSQNLPFASVVDSLLGNAEGTTYQIDLTRLVSLVSALLGPTYSTRALLYADLAWPERTVAYVRGDATAGYNGVYRKTGASGAGAWTRVGDLPTGAIEAGLLTELEDRLSNDLAAVAGVLDEWPATPLAWMPGAYIDRLTGAVVASGSYRYAKVAVTPGEHIRLTGDVQGTGVPQWIWYDAAGAMISSHGRGEAVSVELRGVVVTAPAGAAQLGVTQQTAAAAPFVVERSNPIGSIPDYMAARAQAERRSWSDISVDAVAGQYIRRTDGVLVANAAYSHAKVSCVAGDLMRVSADLFGGAIGLVVWYGAGGAYLSSFGSGSDAAPAQYRDVELTVPAGAVTMGLTWRTTDAAPLRVQIASVSDTLDAFVAARLDEERRSWSGVPVVATPGSYIRRTDGALVANTGYSYALLDVAAGDQMRISADLFGAVIGLAVWYGPGGTYLGVFGSGSNSAAVQYRDVELTVPAGAVKMGLTWRTTDAAPLRVQAARLAGSLDEFVDARLNYTGVGGYWLGRTIAWFGTSIPAGSTSGRYPDQIGMRLGAQVYNEALSGSPCRGGVRSAVTGADPYGFAGTSWAIATKALAHTTAEKMDIINNWAAYRGLFSVASAAPTTLTASQQSAILNSSFEVRLVAAHLGANRRDAYVFDHGFNDVSLANDLMVGDRASRDRLTYRGAMNYLVDLILADNPRAVILFIGHYDSSDPVRTTLISAQQAVADDWSRPIWRGWEALGWSSAVEVETTGYWSGNVWIPSGGPAQTLSMAEVWTPDGVHPAQDISGTSIRRIVDAMIPWWQSTAR